MGNSPSAVFPHPMESTETIFPSWAIAIAVAAAVVTLLWTIAIIILICYEIFVSGQHRFSNKTTHSSVMARRASASNSPLGAPPLSAPSQLTSQPAAQNIAPMKDQVGSMQLAMAMPDGGDSKTNSDINASKSDSEDNTDTVEDDSANFKKPMVSQSPAIVDATDVTSLDENEDHNNALGGMVLSRPVTVRQLGATIREPGYIEAEFRKLPNLTVSPNDLPVGTQRKNRYTNVLPTSRTRVHLPRLFGHSNSDYINGNYIRGCRGKPRQYIATQGPLESTVEDFWRMILDNDAPIIIMATNFQERGIEKCTRYWPAQGSEEYGSVQVTLLQQTAHGTYNTSILQVQASGGVAKTVTHYRLTFWPHQGVPQDTKALTDFFRTVRMADYTGPAVVHCSSGIGRTGVLLACDIGMQGFLQGDPKVDVLRIASTLRQDRAGMIQTREQYRFIHQALYNVVKEEYSK